MCFIWKLTYELSASLDMIVKIHVTKLLAWNYSRNVTDLRYFL